MNILEIDVPVQDLILFGFIIGTLIGVPLITFLLTRQHRWLAILALNAFYIIAYVIGGWSAALAAVGASVLAILVSAALFRHAFAESTWSAFTYEIALGFGRTKGMQIIEEGKTVLPKEGGQLLGPRTVIVKPNNAVILERGGQQTRVSGPAVITTGPFEYVKRILDLRPRQERLTIGRVMTGDFLAVDAVLSVTYRIDIPEEMRLGKPVFGESETKTIREFDLRVQQWEQTVNGVIESCVRQYVGSVDMVDVLKPIRTRELEQQVRQLSDTRCKEAWHIAVDSVVLERVLPVSETAVHMNDRAKAAVQRDTLRIIAEGYQLARDRGMTNDEIQYEVLRHTLEQIAKDSTTELFLTPELQDLVSMLRQGRNGRNVPPSSKP